MIKKILVVLLTLSAYAAEPSRSVNCLSLVSFLQNPPVYFYCIYRDYHNHRYDDGIKKAEKALKEIEPLFKKNPDGIVPNATKGSAKLRDPRVKAAVSDLHMLLGMLYYQKSMNLEDASVKKLYDEFYNKLEKNGLNFFEISELMNLYTKKRLFPDDFSKRDEKRYRELLSKAKIKEKDLDRFMFKTQQLSEQLDEKRLFYLRRAVSELQEAVKVDPKNGLAYYQLGNLYSGALGEDLPEASSAAEEAYYKAALIFKEEGDREAFKEVLKKLELANPHSKYLKELKVRNEKG